MSLRRFALPLGLLFGATAVAWSCGDRSPLGVGPRAPGLAASKGSSHPGGDETDDTDDDEYRFESTVAAAARKDADFGALAASQHWVTTAADPDQPVWTDDYSNVVGAVLRKLRAPL